MGSDDAGAHGIGRKGNVVRSLGCIVEHRRAVSDGIYFRPAGLLMQIYQECPITEKFQATIHLLGIGTKSDAKNGHIRIIRILVCHYPLYEFLALYFLNHLSKCSSYAVFP